MKTSKTWLAFGAAFSLALVAGACGGTMETGGPKYTACTNDADGKCAVDELCHPTFKICIQSCTTPDKCTTQTTTTCTNGASMTTADGGTTSNKFCGCSTSSNCPASHACVSGVCVPECKAAASADGGSSSSSSSYSCPTGFTCDAASKACKAASCSPACGATEYCDTSGASPTCVAKCTPGSCGSGKVCNASTFKCETAKSCSTANAQPDVCAYGQYCASSSCTEVTKPTCGNWTPPGGKTPVFDPAVSTGPIIYSVVDEATNDDAFCSAPAVAFTTTLTAYRTDIAWPTASSGLSGFKYVNTSGAESDATMNLRPSGYTKTGNVASFKVTLCANASNASIVAGFYFTNGNEVCATIVR